MPENLHWRYIIHGVTTGQVLINVCTLLGKREPHHEMPMKCNKCAQWPRSTGAAMGSSPLLPPCRWEVPRRRPALLSPFNSFRFRWPFLPTFSPLPSLLLILMQSFSGVTVRKNEDCTGTSYGQFKSDHFCLCPAAGVTVSCVPSTHQKHVEHSGAKASETNDPRTVLPGGQQFRRKCHMQVQKLNKGEGSQQGN